MLHEMHCTDGPAYSTSVTTTRRRNFMELWRARCVRAPSSKATRRGEVKSHRYNKTQGSHRVRTLATPDIRRQAPRGYSRYDCHVEQLGGLHSHELRGHFSRRCAPAAIPTAAVLDSGAGSSIDIDITNPSSEAKDKTDGTSGVTITGTTFN